MLFLLHLLIHPESTCSEKISEFANAARHNSSCRPPQATNAAVPAMHAEKMRLSLEYPQRFILRLMLDNSHCHIDLSLFRTFSQVGDALPFATGLFKLPRM